MAKISWKFSEIDFEFPLLPGEIDALRIQDVVPVSQWAEEYFRLTKAYVNPGKLRLHPWQKEPLDAVGLYDYVYYVAPVQTGKSMLGEIGCMYAIDTWNLNGMMVYANEKTVKKVFKFRIKEAIEQVPRLRRHWSGKDDDLTISNIELQNCLWGVASAENKNDIASFPAGFVYGSEVAKYREKDFNPVAMMRGRQQAYLSKGLHKMVLESSPYDVGDTFYQQIYQGDTIILDPHIQCPHCKQWQTLTDRNIVDITETRKPSEIRKLKESGVRYECPFCHDEITEKQRTKSLVDVVWAATEIHEGPFKQEAEMIDPDGFVDRDPEDHTAVCFHWNRFVDPAYKFYEALARFLESKNDPARFRVYENEDMARFWRSAKNAKSGITAEELLDNMGGYYMGGEKMDIPEGVIVSTVGIDTQDTGFVYVVRGYGEGMETWLLHHGFIYCDKKSEQYKNPETVLNLFKRDLFPHIPKNIRFGFIDRGGHRAELVDYLCDSIPWLHAYIGSNRIDPKQPLVKESTTADHFMGQTQLLSEKVAEFMGSDLWHLPVDVGGDYLRQVVAQYYVEEEDKLGQVKQKFICEREDHYRDAENMNFGAATWLQLEKLLFSEEGMRKVRAYYEYQERKKKQHEFIKEKNKDSERAGQLDNRPETVQQSRRHDSPYTGRRRWSR